MVVTYYDNPATRLLNILNKFKVMPTSISAEEALRRIFDYPLGTSQTDILLSIGKLHNLIVEIHTYFKVHDPEYLETCEYFAHTLSNFLYLAGSNLNSPCSTIMHYLDTHTMMHLKSTERIINALMVKEQLSYIKKIDDVSLQEINDSVRELYEEVFKSEDITSEIKSSILKYLSRLIEAIDQYHITGTEAIITALETTVGHMFFNPEYRQYMTETPTGKSILSKMGEIGEKVTCAVGFIELANNGFTLLNNIKDIVI